MDVRTREHQGRGSAVRLRLDLDPLERRVLLSSGFGPAELISSSPAGASAVRVVDLDGDGDGDVLSASLTSGVLAWHENLGGGSFGSERVIAAAAGQTSLMEVADFDGDGDPDVLSMTEVYRNGESDYTVAWYPNLGGSGFGTARIVDSGRAYPIRARVADVDADGAVDVILERGFKLVWHRNTGSGAFGPEQILRKSDDLVMGFQAADMDGDGDADVLATVLSFHSWEFEQRTEWYENDSAHTFATRHVVKTAGGNDSLAAVADLDGDGDADVLLASYLGDRIAWCENLGESFGPRQTILAWQGGSYAVQAADLDGDGDADVLAVPVDGSRIAWVENLGAGGFGPEQVVATYPAPARSAFAGDVDGDGRADVVAATGTADAVVWFRNLGVRPILRAVSPLAGATEDEPHTVTYAALAAAADESGVEGATISFRVESVLSGTLAKGGSPAALGSTLLGPGEELVWQPAPDANGIQPAFMVTAWDGQLTSPSPVQVSVVVAPANDAPTLTGIAAQTGVRSGGELVLTYDALASAGDEADADGDALQFRVESVMSGVLTKSGAPVAPGATLLGPGEHWVWEPAAGAVGTLPAFSIVAWDGQAESGPAVQVAVRVEPLSYVGSITGAGPGVAYVYDEAGPVDVALQDVQVSFDRDGRVASVVLSGSYAMGGLGLVIDGGSAVGVSFKDGRKGSAGDIAFIVCEAPIRQLALKGGVSGADVTGVAEGRVPLAAGFDATNAAIYTTGWAGSLSLSGDLGSSIHVAGDLKSLALRGGNLAGAVTVDGSLGKLDVKGSKSRTTGHYVGGTITADAVVTVNGVDPKKGMSLASISTSGHFLGSLTTDGGVGKIRIGGDFGGSITTGGGLGGFEARGGEAGGGRFLAGGMLQVGGFLGRCALAGYDTAGVDKFGICIEGCKGLQLGALKLSTADLPFVDGDFAVRLG